MSAQDFCSNFESFIQINLSNYKQHWQTYEMCQFYNCFLFINEVFGDGKNIVKMRDSWMLVSKLADLKGFKWQTRFMR